MAKTIKCIIVDDEPMAREILEKHLQRIDTVEIIGLCKNAIEAFNLLNTHEVDLIFLDINMPEISGLSFAKSIDKNVKVIFTTAYREYAIDGFDLKAVDYLLKPVSFERLIQAIEKFKNESLEFRSEDTSDLANEKTDFFFVRSNRKMMKINYADLQYIESLADYVKLFVNNAPIVTRETISSIEAKLPAKEFLRVHRSFIVSVDKIDSYTQEFIEIQNKAIPISRSYKNDVKRRLDNV